MPDHRVSPRTITYEWGKMIWFIDGESVENPNMSLACMEVHVGSTSERHRHDNSHECIHVLSGTILETVGDESYELSVGETIFIPQGASHMTQNIGHNIAILMISYSESSREYAPVNTA